MTLEYAQIATDTTAVAVQAAEGDQLQIGKIAFGTKTAPVTTFGGAATLSKQAAQRATVPYLDSLLRKLANAAVKHRNAVFRAFYDAQVAARAAAGASVPVADPASWASWVEAIVDAAEQFENEGLPLGALIVPKPVFKQLAVLEAEDGRPMLTFNSGSNTVGTVNPAGLSGSLASVRVVLNPKAAPTSLPAFTSKQAIKRFASPIASLSDQDVISLTQAFSVYGYQALVPETPEGLLPVAIASPEE
jgi:hypothetical protein